MQNAEGDDGYAFIGGHVAFGETTDETFVREFMEYSISLYYDTDVSDVKTLNLCREDDDYRKVHIVDDGHRKLVVKY